MSDWTGKWVAEKIMGHSELSGVNLLSPQHVELIRRQYSTIVVGTAAVKRFDVNTLTPFIEGKPEVSFVINVSKESCITGDALQLGRSHGIPIGGFGDLMSAIGLPDVSQYVNRDSIFIERGLSHHTHVDTYERLEDRRYLVKRRGLGDILVVFLNEYELTAYHVRTARDRYGPFRMLVLTNPNSRPTSSAFVAADSMGSHIYKWGEFLGALRQNDNQ